MSSLAKNFDTLYERTIAEAQNLHARCPVKIYSTDQELYDDGLLDKNSDTSIDGLSWETFTKTILQIYETRFGKSILTWYFFIRKSSISVLSFRFRSKSDSRSVNSGIVNFSIKFFW